MLIIIKVSWTETFEIMKESPMFYERMEMGENEKDIIDQCYRSMNGI